MVLSQSQITEEEAELSMLNKPKLIKKRKQRKAAYKQANYNLEVILHIDANVKDIKKK